MGLSFHYSGRILKPDLLSPLIDEIQDIANVFNWNYFIFNQVFPENQFTKSDYNDQIYGICVTPPKCETIPICFLSNGQMSDYARLSFYGKSTDHIEQQYLYLISVKTQYAGSELHQFIIHLFRYISQKYLADFTLSDEGHYWETNDVEILNATFTRYTNFINSFSSALETIPIKSGEKLEIYFRRLLKILSERKNPEG